MIVKITLLKKIYNDTYFEKQNKHDHGANFLLGGQTSLAGKYIIVRNIFECASLHTTMSVE